MAKRNVTDALELKIAETLTNANVHFVHESENNGTTLDFYLPHHNLYIEVKRFHSNRSNSQLSQQDNIILVQGLGAVNIFVKLLHNLNLK